MEEELLSLKWNNHQSTFLDIIKSLRDRSLFTDSTLACGGQFFPVHKLILSTCSEYFNEIFQNIPCSNPVIILKDIECKNLQFLLDYMYLGEVNVKQNELAALVNVAEGLKIKGLAVPDTTSFLEQHGSSNSSSSMESKDARPADESDQADEIANDVGLATILQPIKVELEDGQDKATDIFQPHDGAEFFEQTMQMDGDTSLLFPKQESLFGETSITGIAGPSGLLNTSWEFRKGFMDRARPKTGQASSMEPSVEQQMVRQWLEQLSRMGGWNKLKCPVCGKVCSRSDKLKLHLRVHTGERPYCCPFCPHRSRTSDDLKRHVRTHTGERPYQCPFCPYRASDPSTIRSHKKHKHTSLYKESLAQKAAQQKTSTDQINSVNNDVSGNPVTLEDSLAPDGTAMED